MTPLRICLQFLSVCLMHSVCYYNFVYCERKWVLMPCVFFELFFLFTHLPFVASKRMYGTAKECYRLFSMPVFWGFECCSAILAVLSVSAHPICVLNSITHLGFLYYGSTRGVEKGRKFYKCPRVLFVSWAIIFDCAVHFVCLASYMKALDISQHFIIATIILVMLLTFHYHKTDLEFRQFFFNNFCPNLDLPNQESKNKA